MAGSVRRRDFIKAASILGSSLAIADPVSAGSMLAGAQENEIKNNYFTVSFDTAKGKINIYRSNGMALLTGGTICINTEAGKRSVDSVNYLHSLTSTAFSDRLGTGKKLAVSSKDREKKSDFEIHISLYDHAPVITFETICKNVSQTDLLVRSLEPLRVLDVESGNAESAGRFKMYHEWRDVL